jgi:hypothetical protein
MTLNPGKPELGDDAEPAIWVLEGDGASIVEGFRGTASRYILMCLWIRGSCSGDDPILRSLRSRVRPCAGCPRPWCSSGARSDARPRVGRCPQPRRQPSPPTPDHRQSRPPPTPAIATYPTTTNFHGFTRRAFRWHVPAVGLAGPRRSVVYRPRAEAGLGSPRSPSTSAQPGRDRNLLRSRSASP